MECPYCHQQLNKGTKVCYHCGAELPSDRPRRHPHEITKELAAKQFYVHVRKARAILWAAMLIAGSLFAAGLVWWLVLAVDRTPFAQIFALIWPLLLFPGIVIILLLIIRHIVIALDMYMHL